MTIIFTLFFDIATENAIRRLWHQIADAGIEVAGLNGHRPHISLAAYDSDDVVQYQTDLQRFVSMHSPLPIRFHHLGVFPEAGVVFLAPRVTRELLMLHTSLLTHFSRPERPPLMYELHMGETMWTPHCTLVRGMPSADIAQVVEICQREWHAIEGIAEGIGMLVLPAPGKVDLCQYRFRDGTL